MVKDLFLYLLVILILASCNSTNSTNQNTPIVGLTQGVTIIPSRTAAETVANALMVTTTPSFPTLPPATPNPTANPSSTTSSDHQPFIFEQPGEGYEVLFSIPVGQNNFIQYEIRTQTIEGPNAIAVLPDDSILIADPVGDRLLRYDQAGSLLKTIELDDLGIGYVKDIRVAGGEIFLLETSYQKYRVHRITEEGSLIASEEIPFQFPVDTNNSENTLEGGLTGIAIDCHGRVILEVTGGSNLLPLSEVQNQPDPTNIQQGLLCNGKHYYVSTSGPWMDPQVSAGDRLYQTQLTYGLGGLNFLDVFQGDGIYLVHDDVVTDPVITVDQTVHYIGEDGNVQGVARVPLSEFYYPIMHNTAINPDGEVFAILPRSDSLDIVRLNFYQELDPLIPGAKKPQITLVSNSP